MRAAHALRPLAVVAGASAALAAGPNSGRRPRPGHWDAHCAPARCEAAAGQRQEALWREEILGIDFPRHLEVGLPPKQHRYTIVGTAPRCMQGLCWFPPARAYALGVYVEEFALNRLASDLKDSGREALVRRMFSPDIEKAFHFIFAYQKDGEHIRRGFERSLVPFVEPGDEEGLRAVRGFVNLFKRGQMQPGTTVSVVCQPASHGPGVEVVVKLNGEVVEHFHNGEALAKALHRLYLGLPGVIDDAKYRDIAKRLSSQAMDALP